MYLEAKKVVDKKVVESGVTIEFDLAIVSVLLSGHYSLNFKPDFGVGLMYYFKTRFHNEWQTKEVFISPNPAGYVMIPCSR